MLKVNEGRFKAAAAYAENDKWPELVKRANPIEARPDDVRSEFGRDYTRILHCLGYRRLKHKTQVFFAPQNDHICTRMEHVSHVESVSFTIADYLGMNTELTRAIAIGHDLGHAPFGHLGETILKDLTEKETGETFWHERNGLHFVDDVELLRNTYNKYTNLNLTYAVRDGIISHCGEVDINGLKPRNEAIDLALFKSANQYDPYSWEGCVVKLADKISYLGRDIEDAMLLNLIQASDLEGLLEHSKKAFNLDIRAINTTTLIHLFVIDLCKNSSFETGLRFSEEAYDLMKAILSYNRERIYRHPKLKHYSDYAKDILHKIYYLLSGAYNNLETRETLENMSGLYPGVMTLFIDWLDKYWDLCPPERRKNSYANRVIYNISFGEREYKKAVIDYIAGMSDSFAIRTFNEIISFK